MPFLLKYVTGINDRGLEIKDSELSLLLFIYEQKIIKQSQLFEFTKLVPKLKKIEYISFCNRLKRLEEHGMIKRSKYHLLAKSKIFNYLVEIDIKGLQILYLSGYLESRPPKLRVPQKNLEHHLGIKQTVLDIFQQYADKDGAIIGINAIRDELNEFVYVFDTEKTMKKLGMEISTNEVSKKEKLKIKKEELTTNSIKKIVPRIWSEKDIILQRKELFLRSYSFIKHYLQDRKLSDQIITGLSPDWLFVYNNHTYSIELDTGSENYSVLLLKLAHYLELNKLDPLQNHTVFIVMLDNSIMTRKYTESNRDRISLLKDFFVVQPDSKYRVATKEERDGKIIRYISSTEGEFISLRNQQLDVYIFSLERAAAVFEKVQMNKYQSSRDIRFTFLEQQEDNLNPIALLPDELSKSNILTSSKLDYPIPNLIIKAEINEKSILLFLFHLKEGNIKTMDRMSYFSSKIINREDGFIYAEETAKVVGIYQFEDELLNDINSERVIKSGKAIVLYCIETQKFYDVLTKIEILYEEIV